MKPEFLAELKTNTITRADLLSKEKVGSRLRQVRRQTGLTLKAFRYTQVRTGHDASG